MANLFLSRVANTFRSGTAAMRWSRHHRVNAWYISSFDITASSASIRVIFVVTNFFRPSSFPFFLGSPDFAPPRWETFGTGYTGEISVSGKGGCSRNRNCRNWFRRELPFCFPYFCSGSRIIRIDYRVKNGSLWFLFRSGNSFNFGISEHRASGLVMDDRPAAGAG